MSAEPRVVVLGGGFAGLETAYMLRMKLHDEVDISVVSDRDTFLFKPNTIYIPFGAEEESLLIPLHKPLHRRDIAFHQGRVVEVDLEHKRVRVDDGSVVPYDFLVIGTGATMRPEEVPGLAERASTIWTPTEMRSLGSRLQALLSRSLRGEHSEVLFLVPPNNKCSGPLYEIVFMLETWLRRKGVRDRVHIRYSTYERSFIHAFGPRLHTVVTEEFAERGIDGHTEEFVEKVTDGEVAYSGGSTRRFDDLISFRRTRRHTTTTAFPPTTAAFWLAISRPVKSTGIPTCTRRATPATFRSNKRSSRSCRPTRSPNTSRAVSPGERSLTRSTR